MSSPKHTIITIGRAFGSAGGHIGHAIGQKLGIPFYDNALISKVAEEEGYSKGLFAQAEEKSLFSFSSFFASSRIGYMDGGYVNDNVMFNIQSEVIKSIAQKGNAIFIGRCADYILRDMDCLNVFITAPAEYRAQRLVNSEGLTMEEAEKLMRRKDRTRETYYNYYTFGDWGKASNYHLCVDSSILGVDGTADLIIDFGRKCGKIK